MAKTLIVIPDAKGDSDFMGKENAIPIQKGSQTSCACKTRGIVDQCPAEDARKARCRQ